MRRVPRMAATGLAVLALAASAPGAAHALPSPGTPRPASPVPPGSDDGLPEGWRLAGQGNGRELVWAADEPVPMGDARVEFYSGDKLLGRPSAARDRRSFRLPLNGEGVGPAKKLRVMAGGRRLDEAAAAPESRAPRPAVPAALPPANSVDPGKKGRYATTSGAYKLKSVRLPGFPEPVEMRADVIGPKDAPGKRPFVLFLHGRHYTCYGSGEDQGGGWPCKGGTKPVPSQAGYHKAQQLLASQGYVTVSIAANGINGQDHRAEDGGAQARSSLVRLHLGQWADWARQPAEAPEAVRAVAPADLSRVLLVGHSRGGEGVNRAALDSLYAPPADQDGYHGPTRWKIRGNVLIGPTVFGQNPVPDVPSATILPGCDGDVSDLQGEIYVDGTRRVSRGKALHSAVYMVGANHNFFNSEWTPGQAKAPADDDFGDDSDPLCAPRKDTRLTASQQQRAGATYIAAAARLFVAGDDRVRPLLDGTDRRAPSAGPARVLTHAVGAHRTAALVPDASTKVTGGKVCAQVTQDAARACLPPETAGGSPHFAAWDASPEPGRDAVSMRWTRPGTPVRMSPARPLSLAGAD
ncbi:alpha/beta hydrolase family protein, partial [Streptomyces flavofungini]|uniref:alpha/beta hydrolase family protein n=1 Tax=Streptomyces flavofungini TaxID=68200 RepID=UPI003F7D2627